MHGPARAIRGAVSLLVCGSALAWSSPAQGTRPFHLKWLSDLGAESMTAASPTSELESRAVFASVPGAVYAFAPGQDGTLLKLSRIGSDSSIPYGTAVAGSEAVVAHEDKSVSLWSFRPGGPGALRWRRPLGERVVSVAWDGGDQIWIASRANRLLALAASDGRLLWSTNIEGKAEGPAVTDGKHVFVATKSGELLRLDGATGAVRWKTVLPGPAIHPPVLAGTEARLLVCGTWNGHLLAYDVSSGKLAWSLQLPDRLAGPSLAGEDFVAAVTSDGTVHCFDLSGQPKWKSPDAARGAADLLFHGSGGARPRLVVASSILTALDLATGERLDEYPRGAMEDLQRRFLAAMMEGERAYSEREKGALLESQAFPLGGRLFGEVRAYGGSLVLGTEEGWMYLFDAASLRPIARYRAGLRGSIPPRLAGDTVVASAGEELFGLDPLTGEARWRRSLGGAVKRLEGGPQIGVIAGGRLNLLSPSSGARQWSVQGEFHSLCAPPAGLTSLPWLAADDDSIHAFDSSGRPQGDPLATGAELVGVVAQERSWAAATRAGKAFGLAWTDETLIKTWEIDLEGSIADIQPAGGRLLIVSQAGYLASLEDGHEVWRSPLAPGKDYKLTPLERSAVLQAADGLNLYDIKSGKLVFSQKLSTPAVGTTLTDSWLLWLDSSGRANRVSMGGEPRVESTDLGVPLEQAWPVRAGFLVATAAGEVGFVEYADDGPPTVESTIKQH